MVQVFEYLGLGLVYYVACVFVSKAKWEESPNWFHGAVLIAFVAAWPLMVVLDVAALISFLVIAVRDWSRHDRP